MNWLLVSIIIGLFAFSIGSAIREVLMYRRAVRGEVHYLVSRPRLHRRLLISLLLFAEAALLFAGSFVLSFDQAGASLLFWCIALVVMMPVFYLALLDMRETRRDIDRIFHEAIKSALKNVQDAKKQ